MPKAPKNCYFDELKFTLTSTVLLATNYKTLISMGFWHIRHIIYKTCNVFYLVDFIVLVASLKGKPS
jgi:hypothetical protein